MLTTSAAEDDSNANASGIHTGTLRSPPEGIPGPRRAGHSGVCGRSISALIMSIGGRCR